MRRSEATPGCLRMGQGGARREMQRREKAAHWWVARKSRDDSGEKKQPRGEVLMEEGVGEEKAWRREMWSGGARRMAADGGEMRRLADLVARGDGEAAGEERRR